MDLSEMSDDEIWEAALRAEARRADMDGAHMNTKRMAKQLRAYINPRIREAVDDAEIYHAISTGIEKWQEHHGGEVEDIHWHLVDGQLSVTVRVPLPPIPLVVKSTWLHSSHAEH